MFTVFRPFVVRAAAAICLSSLLLPVLTVRAEDVRETTSLKFAPADAAFYLTSLRNKEVFDAFLATNAYQKLKNMPLVVFGLSMLEGQWNNENNRELQQVKLFFEEEENKELLSVVGDLFSHEVFFFSDASFVAIAKTAQDIQRQMNKLQYAAIGGGNPEDFQQKLGELISSRLQELKTPNLLVGFKVTNGDATARQLNRLESLLRELCEREEELAPLKQRISREKIAGGNFLVLRLDGTLIPWDRLPEGDDESKKAMREKLKEIISKLKVTISLGVKDGYLVLAIGDSNDFLKTLGQGELLASRKEFAPLAKHADKRITSIAYVSQAAGEQLNSVAGQIDDAVSLVEGLLKMPQAEIDDAVRRDLSADIKQLGEEIKRFVPKPGAVVGFNFMTDQGWEGLAYSWAENKSLDGSQKLTILDHVGGDTIGFVASRGKYSPDSYDWVVKWVKKAWDYGERIGLPRASDEDRKKFEQVRDQMLPLVKRFDLATREFLLPAGKDGQGALVLDARARSKQWLKVMPAASRGLPMFELGAVYTITDPQLVKQAATEYFQIAQDVLVEVRKLDENANVPDFTLPQPDDSEIDGGTLYSYTIPEEAGVDPQIAPNAALTQNTLVLSALPEFTKRLVKATPPPAIGPLANLDRPLATASYFNMAKFLDTLSPWINFGLRSASKAAQEEEGSNPAIGVGLQMAVGNLQPILELLKCMKETASVSYFEDGALVTHSVTVLQDAP